MKPTICKACGERMPPSQNPLCASCRAIEPPEQQPEEHWQSEWKQEIENDDVVLRKVWEK
jgi:hypothetical protein